MDELREQAKPRVVHSTVLPGSGALCFDGLVRYDEEIVAIVNSGIW